MVGHEFEFAGANLGAVLLTLQFTHFGDELIGRAVETPYLSVEDVRQPLADAPELVSEGRAAIQARTRSSVLNNGEIPLRSLPTKGLLKNP